MKTNIISCFPENAQENRGANSGKIIKVSEDTIMITKSFLLQKNLRERVNT